MFLKRGTNPVPTQAANCLRSEQFLLQGPCQHEKYFCCAAFRLIIRVMPYGASRRWKRFCPAEWASGPGESERSLLPESVSLLMRCKRSESQSARFKPFKVPVLRSIERFKSRLKGAFRCAIARHLSYLCPVLQRLKFDSEQSAGFHRHKVNPFSLFACLTEGVLRSVQARA